MPNPGITLPGFKTYIVAAVTVLIGVLKGVFDIDIPGAPVGEDWISFILVGSGLGSMRAAIQKLIDVVVTKK